MHVHYLGVSCVYAIKCGDFELYKVGYTGNLPARIQTAQVNCPFPLRAQIVVETTKRAAPKAEWRAKHRLAEYLHAGEWYATDPARIKMVILACVEEVETKLYKTGVQRDKDRWIYDRADVPTLPIDA